MITERFGPEAFQAATGASPRVMADMAAYRDMLADWSGRMNLVGPSALEQFWPRHAYDSAQLLPLQPEALRWMDIGSGAGLPGLVLAILGKDRPGMTVQLVESTQKKCAFLQAVVQALDLPASVVRTRVEELRGELPEVLTARAVAPLVRLLEYAHHQLRSGATAIFLKGRNVEEEIAEALQSWRFDYALTPSLSDPEGRILRIWSVRRASA